jgi:hypothetical protein
MQSCPFEPIRQYRKSLSEQFTKNVFSSQEVFVVQVKCKGSRQNFTENFGCVGKNTISDKIKSFLGDRLSKGATGSDDSVEQSVSGYGKGVRRSTFTGHSGRNTAITYAMAENVSESNISASTGHADVNSLRGYAQPTRDSKASVSLAVSRQLGQHREQAQLRKRLIEEANDDLEEEENTHSIDEDSDEEEQPVRKKKTKTSSSSFEAGKGQTIFNIHVHH